MAQNPKTVLIVEDSPVQVLALEIVMLTTLSQAPMVLQGIELGAIDYISKDAFSKVVLLETLRQMHILDDAQAAKDGYAEG